MNGPRLLHSSRQRKRSRDLIEIVHLIYLMDFFGVSWYWSAGSGQALGYMSLDGLSERKVVQLKQLIKVIIK